MWHLSDYRFRALNQCRIGIHAWCPYPVNHHIIQAWSGSDILLDLIALITFLPLPECINVRGRVVESLAKRQSRIVPSLPQKHVNSEFHLLIVDGAET